MPLPTEAREGFSGLVGEAEACARQLDGGVDGRRARVLYPRGTHEAEATREVDWWDRTRAEYNHNQTMY